MTKLPLNQLDKIYQGDCLKILATLPEKSVDMVFADPPYNLQLNKELWRPNLTLVDAVDDSWDQFNSFTEYDNFTRQWLEAVRRVMKKKSSIWISGTYHNIFRIGAIMQDMGFWILNTITWFKPNAMPNFAGTRFKNDIEMIIWAKPFNNKSGYTFNYHKMKQFNNGKQLGSLWDIEPDRDNGKQLAEDSKDVPSIWKIQVCNGSERLKDIDGKKLHSTQKPEALLYRIILAGSKKGDVILDPFMGSGTTAAVAKHLHRHWIGIDSNKKYVEAARNRVEKKQPLGISHTDLQERSIPKKVSFEQLVKLDYLESDQSLYLKKSDATAIILDDGNIKVNGYTGSIHQVAKKVKEVQSCNGWTQWYYVDKETGEKRLIDSLRKLARKEHPNL